MTQPSLPPYALPAENSRVLLMRRPAGIPQPGDFELAREPVPLPGEGEFLVRNLYLSVDPAQRGWAADVANYSAPVPIGGVMRALAVGVVRASRCKGVAEGDILYGWFGWQHYCAAGADAILLKAQHDVPVTACLGLLGINGLTAFLALEEIGHPREGDTLVVSTAAGAVGGFVGQIGKLRGCRTVGLTGSAEKVARCLESYRYDVAINYKDTDWEEQLLRALPEGANVYFDNAGGPILDGVLRRMAVGGRIVQCGTASIASWDPVPQGPRNEREILTRRLQWGGFVIFDHRGRFPQAAAQLAQWHKDGAIRYDEDISTGLESAPGAIASLYAGANRGKRIIDVTGT
ncbi:MAG TPA: NADP-dependent oxidoreductase [Novosphingobium sp.]|nr:NADP-dependent oxidoreductase [Novosphingobium sp.]